MEGPGTGRGVDATPRVSGWEASVARRLAVLFAGTRRTRAPTQMASGRRRAWAPRRPGAGRRAHEPGARSRREGRGAASVPRCPLRASSDPCSSKPSSPRWRGDRARAWALGDSGKVGAADAVAGGERGAGALWDARWRHLSATGSRARREQELIQPRRKTQPFPKL